ncbi:hypothetical protein Tco_0266819 [Tanacetum coccineum]
MDQRRRRHILMYYAMKATAVGFQILKVRHVIPVHTSSITTLCTYRGGESSRKYCHFSYEDQAADYGILNWIRRLSVPNSMRVSDSQLHDKFASLGNLTLGQKDEEILCICGHKGISCDSKKADFHRLRMDKDIEDHAVLLVQESDKSHTLKRRIAFNVSLNECSQEGSNVRRKETLYTPNSGSRGFIYENKDKKNRLMRIDELHKFSDGTLDDVRTALNDRLKGIRMEYLP